MVPPDNKQEDIKQVTIWAYYYAEKSGQWRQMDNKLEDTKL